MDPFIPLLVGFPAAVVTVGMILWLTGRRRRKGQLGVTMPAGGSPGPPATLMHVQRVTILFAAVLGMIGSIRPWWDLVGTTFVPAWWQVLMLYGCLPAPL